MRTSESNEQLATSILVRFLDLEFLYDTTGTARSAALAPRRRLAQTPPATRLELLRQIFFVQRASDRELRVNDVGDVKVSRLTKQFDGFVPLEAIVLHQPVYHLGAGE